ncbi:hypothetical protein NQZ68_025910 [Dissostichus eleginoides]|nr:hypothetical protein NQZ68_025910 [Dissostichus eleginoides]
MLRDSLTEQIPSPPRLVSVLHSELQPGSSRRSDLRSASEVQHEIIVPSLPFGGEEREGEESALSHMGSVLRCS